MMVVCSSKRNDTGSYDGGGLRHNLFPLYYYYYPDRLEEVMRSI
jgi:hypothetical protein